jgi:hypothetical protein
VVAGRLAIRFAESSAAGAGGAALDTMALAVAGAGGGAD